MERIGVHQHIVPPRFADRLRELGVYDAGGRANAAALVPRLGAPATEDA
jgi:hypothetical protein